MEQIEPTYVTYQQSLWLKGIGFDVPCIKAYAEVRRINSETGGDIFTGEYRLVTLSRFHKRFYKAPEQWQVIEWWRINHGIWITVDFGAEYWYWKIRAASDFPITEELQEGICRIPLVNLLFSNVEHFQFTTPQEAYSAAFDYIKDNILD